PGSERFTARWDEVDEPTARESDQGTGDGAVHQGRGRDHEDDEVGAAGHLAGIQARDEDGDDQQQGTGEHRGPGAHRAPPRSTMATRSRVSGSTKGETTAVPPRLPSAG